MRKGLLVRSNCNLNELMCNPYSDNLTWAYSSLQLALYTVHPLNATTLLLLTNKHVQRFGIVSP
jgi:hypothetical protein